MISLTFILRTYTIWLGLGFTITTWLWKYCKALSLGQMPHFENAMSENWVTLASLTFQRVKQKHDETSPSSFVVTSKHQHFLSTQKNLDAFTCCIRQGNKYIYTVVVFQRWKYLWLLWVRAVGRLAHCCTIFLKSSVYRNPNIHIRDIISSCSNVSLSRRFPNSASSTDPSS